MPSIDESQVAWSSPPSSSRQQQQQQQHAPFLLNHSDSFGEEWSHFLCEEDDEVEDVSSDHQHPRSSGAIGNGTPRNMIIELPPQLHPAVSEGMRKISSCYFSVRSSSSGNNINSSNSYPRNGSLSDIFSFLDCDDESLTSMASHHQASSTATAGQETHRQWDSAQDLLYHDILMNVFGFLDADSLAAFSETARRPNFEVFYYLQLQLQRALLPVHANGDTNCISSCGLSPMAGTGLLVRLSRADYKSAEQIVQGYLDSNTSLRQMPLSHSLEYIRQVFLMRHQRPITALDFSSPTGSQVANVRQHQEQQPPDASLFSRAALFIALIGAASYTMNTETLMANMDAFMPPAAELPNMLFRVGFLGSLMSAARSFAIKHGGANRNASRNSMKQQAEQFGRNMMQAFLVVLQEEEENQRLKEERNEQRAGQHSSATTSMTSGVRAMMLRMMRAAYSTAYGYEHQRLTDSRNRSRNSRHLFSPDPYDHLPPLPPSPEVDEEEEDDDNSNPGAEPQIPVPPLPRPKPFGEDDSNISEVTSSAIHESTKQDTLTSAPEQKDDRPEDNVSQCKKTPTGCVGAYRRAISQVSKRLVEMVKEERLKKYKALSEEEQRRLGTVLVSACASDDGLQDVKAIVDRGIDVEDFYVAGDGTETSALHAAAAHGAVSILEYLLRQTGPNSEEDGGLCQVNLKDSNGWTALHFAAGSHSTQAVRILAQHGADLTVEAANGYTPLHWAIRLQNTAVAEELRQLLAERSGSGAFNHQKRYQTTWPSPPDLSRFFFGGAVQSH